MRTLFFISLLFLFGCGDPSTEDQRQLSPEEVSLGFFKAIYVDRDVEQAKQFVDEPIKQVLTHYYIAAAVQRNMLGLSMTNVEMEIDDIDIDFFRKFTKDVIVVIKMKGLKGGQPWIDDRTIRLHKIGSKWTIVELMPEKRKVNG
ncbi:MULTISPECIES: hypothetical protein [Shewanella]|uniref:Lipoprotein n=1 Tax=Shewanella baltica (strain OS195) TaxID=399599 RepID=A9L607_SHEB9|nr:MULTISPECIES: hypothetical protein [Shewanella]ABX49941.1 conserved hypothetical protein [Shewanella baltica OS195]ADT94929.1 hypothetical protein Sbal678_2779 [Shewanella baltica OS678]AEG10947.1 hypothetical protein Sbal175_1671 [Shewanella baltica BA175]EHQ15523.1 hypothetical protein Sbal183_2633 [Shewanella baltica OS183]MCI2963539.1 hypothetical protein [Shewanella sp. N2AIL]